MVSTKRRNIEGRRPMRSKCLIMIIITNVWNHPNHHYYHPWSNSSPRGLEDCVRRACFPSIPSRVCDRNNNIATPNCRE